MLVLSRRVDEQIKIGDDVTVTIVKLEGNRVRVGVSAPSDVRVLRGEIAADDSVEASAEFELSEREFAFAHESAAEKIADRRKKSIRKPDARVFSGKVSADGKKVGLGVVSDLQSKPAPLAGFVSAS